MKLLDLEFWFVENDFEDLFIADVYLIVDNLNYEKWFLMAFIFFCWEWIFLLKNMFLSFLW